MCFICPVNVRHYMETKLSVFNLLSIGIMLMEDFIIENQCYAKKKIV